MRNACSKMLEFLCVPSTVSMKNFVASGEECVVRYRQYAKREAVYFYRFTGQTECRGASVHPRASCFFEEEKRVKQK